ncbi:MAG: hypothetical protein R3Y12_04270 [Clostridia bacterium]
MNTNEIITTEEIVDFTEEIETTNSGNKLETIAGIGLVIGVGVIAYKYGVKPLIARFKSKTEDVCEDLAEEEVDIDCGVEEVEEETLT